MSTDGTIIKQGCTPLRSAHSVRRAALWTVLVSITLSASSSYAQTSISLIQGGPRPARSQYRAARKNIVALRAQQGDLERQITRLKKTGRRAPQLDRLLKRSVQAEATLDQARAALLKAERAFGGALAAAVNQIDVEIRKRVPRLKTGPLRSRRRAAGQINQLRALRKQLRAEAADLARRHQRTKVWDQYRVRFDARDGPSELSQKADFVEDTRDKVIKKRRALIKLLAEARQQRRIAQAARDFRTDITLFDEETRQGRVLRQGQQGQQIAQGGQQPTQRSNDDGALEGQSPGASSDPPEFNGIGGTPPPTTPTAPTAPTTPTAPSPGATAPGLRAINPDVLLNLRIEDLAAGALDVATLQRYITDLRALERFLSGQADTLRKRADDLEEAEDRNLQR